MQLITADIALLRFRYEASAKETVTANSPHVFLAFGRAKQFTAIVSTGNNGVCIVFASAIDASLLRRRTSSVTNLGFPVVCRLLSFHPPARHGKRQFGPTDEATAAPAGQGAGVGVADALKTQQRLLGEDDAPCVDATGGDEMSPPRFIVAAFVQRLHGAIGGLACDHGSQVFALIFASRCDGQTLSAIISDDARRAPR